MLKKYLEFLKGIFESITHKGGDITFLDYLSGIGMSIAIIALIVLFITLIVGGWKFPRFVYEKFIADLIKKKGDNVDQVVIATRSGNTELVKELKNNQIDLDGQIARRKWIFALGVIVLYVPIIVPTILYLIYLVFHF